MKKKCQVITKPFFYTSFKSARGANSSLSQFENQYQPKTGHDSNPPSQSWIHP